MTKMNSFIIMLVLVVCMILQAVQRQILSQNQYTLNHQPRILLQMNYQSQTVIQINLI